MAKYTIVDQEICIACAACEISAPDIYGYNEENVAFSKIDDNKGVTCVPKELEDDLIEAYEECPTSAIQVSNEPFNHQK